MIIHVVKEDDTLAKIGNLYNVDYQKMAEDNKIMVDEDLVVGQTIVVIKNSIDKLRSIKVNGYAFSDIDLKLLNDVISSLTFLSIFSYQITYNGDLKIINDEKLILVAKDNQVTPVMVVTNIGTEGRFDSYLASYILNNQAIQDILITNILKIMNQKGYGGLNIDFEYLYPEDKQAFLNFISRLKNELAKERYLLLVALAPKTSDHQIGLLYEAHDYQQIGELADYAILMTYEWGYSGGPARAVAPLNLVEKVINYAVTRISSNKILMGIPNYGYDWTLPYIEGSLAKSVANYEAVEIAKIHHQIINYDNQAQTPYFNYINQATEHEVWFEDARSIKAKLELVIKYNLAGISYWTINRFFPQNYLVLKSLFIIIKNNK